MNEMKVTAPVELDLYNSYGFKDQITQQFKLTGAFDKITLDFSECTRMDSTGIGMMMAIKKYVKEDGELVITNPTKYVVKKFEKLKLHNFLTVI